MKYLQSKFTVGGQSSEDYRKNWERIFGKKKKTEEEKEHVDEHAPVSDIEFNPEETPDQ